MNKVGSAKIKRVLQTRVKQNSQDNVYIYVQRYIYFVYEELRVIDETF